MIINMIIKYYLLNFFTFEIGEIILLLLLIYAKLLLYNLLYNSKNEIILKIIFLKIKMI